MNIIVQQSADVDFAELSAFMFQVREAECQTRGLSLAELEDRLENVWHFIGFVLARSERALIGYALLYQIGESDLIEINPGTLLGHHPIVAPGFNEQTVGSALVESAKTCVREAGYNALYIDIPWDPSAPQESYDVYRERYGQLGFEVIQQVRQMNLGLPVEVPEISIPPGLVLKQIQAVNAEALYQCHHEAYLQGQAQYYFQMDEAERRDDFERIYAPNIREHPASLVLTQGGTVIGYILLFTQGDFSEVMSLAVHPDYRRRGYGKLLIQACLKHASDIGLATMHLIVDVKNKNAEVLYRQCGFNDVGGNMTFKWKTQ